MRQCRAECDSEEKQRLLELYEQRYAAGLGIFDGLPMSGHRVKDEVARKDKGTQADFVAALRALLVTATPAQPISKAEIVAALQARFPNRHDVWGSCIKLMKDGAVKAVRVGNHSPVFYNPDFQPIEQPEPEFDQPDEPIEQPEPELIKQPPKPMKRPTQVKPEPKPIEQVKPDRPMKRPAQRTGVVAKIRSILRAASSERPVTASEVIEQLARAFPQQEVARLRKLFRNRLADAINGTDIIHRVGERRSFAYWSQSKPERPSAELSAEAQELENHRVEAAESSASSCGNSQNP